MKNVAEDMIWASWEKQWESARRIESKFDPNVILIPFSLLECDHFGSTTLAYFFDQAFVEPFFYHCVVAAAKTKTIRYFMTFKPSKDVCYRAIIVFYGFKLIHQIKVNKKGRSQGDTVLLYEKVTQIQCTEEQNLEFNDLIWRFFEANETAKAKYYEEILKICRHYDQGKARKAKNLVQSFHHIFFELRHFMF
jgi:hypothetical protein